MSKAAKGLQPREVFLSHASGDRKMARRIAETLRRHGIPVWYSETNLLGAQQWHDEIGKALARCDWFAVLLSPKAVRSEWVKRELLYALRTLRYRNRIVPVLHRACDPDKLSWTLNDFQRVDLTQNFAAGCKALLRTWGIGYQPPVERRNRIGD
jgi:hypothetical protein